MSDGVAYITLQQFCTFHQCETLVIEEFLDYGIFEVPPGEKIIVIPTDQVPRIERALRLRNDLGVNAAGIDIILRLVERIEGRRRIYSSDDYSSDE